MKKIIIVLLSIMTLSCLPIAAMNKIHKAVLESQSTFGQNTLKTILEKLSNQEKKQLIDQPDDEQTTPLQYAMVNNDYQGMETLLENGANPNLLSPMPHSIKKDLNKEKLAPMHLAVICEDTKMIQILLKYKANIDSVASNNGSALALATMSNDNKIVSFLLNNGAKPNQMCGQWTLTKLALNNKNITMMLDFKKHGAKLTHEEDQLLEDLFGAMLVKSITIRNFQSFEKLINTIMHYNIMSFDHLQKHVAQTFALEGILQKKDEKLSNNNKK